MPPFSRMELAPTRIRGAVVICDRLDSMLAMACEGAVATGIESDRQYSTCCIRSFADEEVDVLSAFMQMMLKPGFDEAVAACFRTADTTREGPYVITVVVFFGLLVGPAPAEINGMACSAIFDRAFLALLTNSWLLLIR